MLTYINGHFAISSPVGLAKTYVVKVSFETSTYLLERDVWGNRPQKSMSRPTRSRGKNCGQFRQRLFWIPLVLYGDLGEVTRFNV